MYIDINVEESLKIENAIFVDLRSPKEHELDTITGAVNVPLFSNEEREIIGAVYMEQGVQIARRLGLELVSVKLPILVDTLISLKNKGPLILFCWRGGERSKAVAKILDIMHIPCFRLEQGYRDYRQYVRKNLYEQPLSQNFLVLHGLTGAGKTEIIRRMAGDGYSALDLEDLANHRGSVFGAVGMKPQPSQKKFETNLWDRISKFPANETIVVEGESKKIGRLYIPDGIFQGMVGGHRALVFDKMENRVKRLIDNYVGDDPGSLEEIFESSNFLARKIGKLHTAELQELLLAGSLAEFVTALLSEYYDVLYSNNIETADKYDLVVDASNLDKAVSQIENYLNQLQ